MVEKIVLFGFSGHAKVVLDILKSSNNYQVKNIVVPDDYKILDNYNDFNFIKESDFWNNDENLGIIGIGDNTIRKKVAEKINHNKPNFKFISAIHSSAQIGSNVKLGDGVVVMPGAIANHGVLIGDHAVINSNSSIDHDCTIGKYSSISPGATLAGNVEVGACTNIGLGSQIIQNIKVGDNVHIGAGSTVINNIPDNCIAYGSPCKKIRDRAEDEKFF